MTNRTIRLTGLLLALGHPLAGNAQTAAVAPASYTLGPGDRLRIIVYGEDALSGEYAVTDAGEVAFPLIGNVAAAGGSTAALQAAIRARLQRGYIKDPRISVEIIDHRPFFILGEVGKPGQYPYTDGLTVDQAVATAGGYTFRASTRKVFVKHAGDAAETRIELERGKRVAVQPGDTLRIAERFF